MDHRHYLLVLALALVASIVSCSGDKDIDVEDIYELLFEPNEQNPLSPTRTLELLKQAQAYYSGKVLAESEKPKVNLINSYVEAGEVRADKCSSSEFKKLNLMYITELYKMKDDEHFGINDLPNLFYDDLHYTNALDYLKSYRRKQVRECIDYLEKSGALAFDRINAKLRKEFTDTSKDFVDSLYRIAKDLIVGSLKSKNGQQEYGEKFKKEVGAACSTISAEIDPLLKLRDVLKSEAKRGELYMSEYFVIWTDRAKTCKGILERIDVIVEGTYNVYANHKSASGSSFLSNILGKCFGKKPCRKSNQ